MISVIIAALNAESTLAGTLAALVPAVVDGLVREAIVVDGGSEDATRTIAEHCGATILEAPGGRGAQFEAGAQSARFPWLLFLHADTRLAPGWAQEAEAFIEAVETGARPPAAAAFRLALDDAGFAPRALEALATLRCQVFGQPSGAQGLLIPRTLYEEAGGFRPLPLLEDADLLRRLGRRRVALLRTSALSSAAAYRREGYFRHMVRTKVCLALFLARAPMARIARIHGTAPASAHVGQTK